MYDHIERLLLDLVAYRRAVDHVISSAATPPGHWQQCFVEISICTSQLYLDYLLVTKASPHHDSLSVSVDEVGLVSIDVFREKHLREELKNKIESSSSWKHFKADNALSTLAGLRNIQDYVDRFTLHLPEIYEETFRAEIYANTLLRTQSVYALSRLLVALQHLGRNHIGFVLQALEWASDEGSWEEVSVASDAF